LGSVDQELPQRPQKTFKPPQTPISPLALLPKFNLFKRLIVLRPHFSAQWCSEGLVGDRTRGANRSRSEPPWPSGGRVENIKSYGVVVAVVAGGTGSSSINSSPARSLLSLFSLSLCFCCGWLWINSAVVASCACRTNQPTPAAADGRFSGRRRAWSRNGGVSTVLVILHLVQRPFFGGGAAAAAGRHQ
jgi:hypothetical protein